MGNAPPAGVQPELRLSYYGPTMGSLPKGVHGAIRSNHLDPVSSEARLPALPIELADQMFNCLGSLEQLPKAPKESLEVIYQSQDHDVESTPKLFELVHPMQPNYVPYFQDRESEYGRGHTYYEALCHALPSFEVIDSASARYFKRNGSAVMAAHLPAPLPIIAFIEALRKKNEGFLDELRKRLEAKEATDWSLVEGVGISADSAIRAFLDGAFRNVAIQIHYRGASRSMEALIHQDHVFSSLHMGVTLHGERAVAFILPDVPQPKSATESFFNELSLPMRKGDVYVSTPASIMHGVATRALEASERSVALQCRTLLDKNAARYWNFHKQALNGVIAKLLGIFKRYLDNILTRSLADMTITMPSVPEVLAAQMEISAAWKMKLPEPPLTLAVNRIAFDD